MARKELDSTAEAPLVRGGREKGPFRRGMTGKWAGRRVLGPLWSSRSQWKLVERANAASVPLGAGGGGPRKGHPKGQG